MTTKPCDSTQTPQLTPEQAAKILAYIDSEWELFLAIYNDISPAPSNATIAALKAGFYTGFKAGVVAMHDPNKIF